MCAQHGTCKDVENDTHAISDHLRLKLRRFTAETALGTWYFRACGSSCPKDACGRTVQHLAGGVAFTSQP